MKKLLVVLSDESYGNLVEYQKAKEIRNLDTALDEILKEVQTN